MGKVELFFDSKPPSRIDEIHDPLFDANQLKVCIKRDDLLHPHISGNKWRKLKYLLMEAEADGKSHIVSFGGAYSNHLPALAAACHELGFESTGFVRGEELTPDSNTQLFFCKTMGMNLHFVDREKYKNKRRLFDEHFGQNDTTLFVDEGGYSALGAKGCEAIIDELESEFDHIILPVGTGTTLAGMANAVNSQWPHPNPSPKGEGRHIEVRGSLVGVPPTISWPKLHGIVVLKGSEYLAEQIKQLSPKSNFWQLHHEFHSGGFAKTTEELLQFIQTKQEEWNIPLEPVYSGKMVFGFYSLLEAGYFLPGERILLVHTGGV